MALSSSSCFFWASARSSLTLRSRRIRSCLSRSSWRFFCAESALSSWRILVALTDGWCWPDATSALELPLVAEPELGCCGLRRALSLWFCGVDGTADLEAPPDDAGEGVRHLGRRERVMGRDDDDESTPVSLLMESMDTSRDSFEYLSLVL